MEPGSESMEMMDSARGIYRFASLEKGKLQGCLFLSVRVQWPLPERASIAALLGTTIDADARRKLFEIDEAITAPARSRTVCACLSVSQAAIERAIVEQRLTSVAEVGRLLRAGTSCGSCIPEIKEILRDAHVAA
jgi:assimilatory nitrate reductase catalytic subunit